MNNKILKGNMNNNVLKMITGIIVSLCIIFSVQSITKADNVATVVDQYEVDGIKSSYGIIDYYCGQTYTDIEYENYYYLGYTSSESIIKWYEYVLGFAYKIQYTNHWYTY